MTAPDLQGAAEFVWCHARLLDRRRFQQLLGDDDGTGVAAALAAHQNGDGGFGHALEPDIRAPTSQTQPAEVAFRTLHEAGQLASGAGAVMAGRALDWLSTVTTADGGVPFVLPSAMEHPRAPWWNTEPDPPASINPTGPLAGLAAAAGLDHPWVAPATAFSWRQVEEAEALAFYDLRAAVTFLANHPDRDRCTPHLERLVSGAIERADIALDPHGEGHALGPLDFVDGPDHPAAAHLPEAAIEAHLDALAAGQQDDGGWTVGWEPPSSTALAEWRGMVTVTALRTLAAFGRVAP